MLQTGIERALMGLQHVEDSRPLALPGEIRPGHEEQRRTN